MEDHGFLILFHSINQSLLITEYSTCVVFATILKHNLVLLTHTITVNQTHIDEISYPIKEKKKTSTITKINFVLFSNFIRNV